MFPSRITSAPLMGIAAAAFALSIVSNQAAAVTVSAIGDNFTLDFDSPASPGLTATAEFTVADISSDALGGQTWTLDVSLSNTSTTPITDARVSILGFNTDIGYDPTDSAVTGIFGTVASGHMPLAGNLDACFKAGGGDSNCAGGGGGGVGIGDTGLFTIMLNFDLALADLVMDNFFVRYQSVVGATSGPGVVGTQVPTPSSMAFLASGLIALASIGRTRRRTGYQA